MALARANLIAAPAASARASRRRSSIVGYVPIIFMAVTSFVPLGDRIVRLPAELVDTSAMKDAAKNSDAQRREVADFEQKSSSGGAPGRRCARERAYLGHFLELDAHLRTGDA